MSVYAIVQGKIENPELLSQYAAKAGATIGPYQGRVVAYDEEPVVIEGRMETPRTVVIEFPSMKEFRTWYESPEYQAVLPLRLKAAPGTLVVVRGRD